MIFKPINRALLPMKGHFFFFHAGSAVMSFLPVYAKQLGFSSIAVGIVYTIMPLSTVVAKPLMGAIADKFHCRQLLFVLFQVFLALSFVGVIMLKEVPNSTNQVRLSCNENGSTVQVCYMDFVDQASDFCEVTCPLDTECSMMETNCKNQSFILNQTYIGENENCHNYPIESIQFSKNTSKAVCPKKQITITCNIDCNTNVLSSSRASNTINTPNSFYHFKEFWFLIGTYLLFFVLHAVVLSIADTVCFQLLDDKPYKYGYQRLFGALGWGTFSIMNGVLLSAFSENENNPKFTPIFIIGGVILLVSALVSYKIKYTQQKLPSLNITSSIFRLLKNARVCVFMLWCIFVGMCTSLIWSFLFWYLEELSEACGSEVQKQIKTIEGVAMGIQCLLGEVPFFFLSSWILTRIGHIHSMTLVLLAIGARYILYSIMKNPWWALPIALFNGPTFGLFYSTMTSYSNIVAPVGTETTTQSLMCALFEGVGVSIGSFLGGLSIDFYGGSITYRIAGLTAVGASIVHAAVQYCIGKVEEPTISIKS